MSERNETIRLIANVSSYVAGMEQARQATAKMTNDSSQKLAQQREAFTQVGQAALAIGAIAATGVALAVARFAEFDQAMSNVKAVTQESTQNMGLLRDAALKFGASSVFTATEAANAIEELGKAGISTADILGGALEGSLNLASAGELGIARAAEIASITLSQFGLDGSDAARVADTLAAGAGKAQGSVDDLANGLKFVGPIANAMNISLEETTGVLAMFAQRGIIGEQAGTSLRGMLSSLTSPSKEARKEIDALGIKLYDSQGKFLGLENAAGQLSKAYVNMTDEQKDASLGLLFGNQQITAARVLYENGADGVAEWTGAVEESGYAARVARDRLDNLKGDVEALGGSLDTFLIKSGSGANDVLRSLVQTLTFFTDIAGEMPDPVLHAGLAVGTVVAAVGLAGGAALIAIPKVVAFKQSLDVLGISAGGAALKVGLIGAAVGVAALAVSLLATRAAESRAKIEAYVDTLEDGTHRITKATRELTAQNLQAVPDFWDRLFGSTSQIESVYDSAEKLGLSLEKVTDAAMGGTDELEELSEYLNRVANDTEFAEAEATRLGMSYGDLQNAADNTARGIKGESDSIEEAIRVAKQKQAADKTTVATTKSTAEAYKAAAKEVEDLESELMSLIDTINKANGVAQDAITANADYQSTLADVKKEVQEYAKANGVSMKAIDDQTVAGSANQAMFAELAESAGDAALAQYEYDLKTMSAKDATEKYLATVESGRQALYEQILAITGNAEAAQALTDKIYAVPTQHQTDMIVNTAQAAKDLNTFIDGFSGKTIYLNAATSYAYNSGSVGGIPQAYGKADGGPITGVGGPRQDNIPIMASVGEHMLDAEDVQKMGGHAGVFAFRRALYMADGGPVSYSPPTYQSAPRMTAPSLAAELPPIYVQNPFTGEYLLAQVDGRASGVVRAQVNTAAVASYGGK